MTISFNKLKRFTNTSAKFRVTKRRGDYSRIADRTGYSSAHVWRVLNGQRSMNEDIMQCTAEFIRNRA